jgi:hypothetical protein
MVSWKIYYADGSTLSNLGGSPEEAPATGVICIKHFSEGEWRILAFRDYYAWDKNDWWGHETAGFWQYMFKPGIKIVKFGTSTDDFNFERIMAEAREDTSYGMERIT